MELRHRYTHRYTANVCEPMLRHQNTRLYHSETHHHFESIRQYIFVNVNIYEKGMHKGGAELYPLESKNNVVFSA